MRCVSVFRGRRQWFPEVRAPSRLNSSSWCPLPVSSPVWWSPADARRFCAGNLVDDAGSGVRRHLPATRANCANRPPTGIERLAFVLPVHATHAVDMPYEGGAVVVGRGIRLHRRPRASARASAFHAQKNALREARGRGVKRRSPVQITGSSDGLSVRTLPPFEVRTVQRSPLQFCGSEGFLRLWDGLRLRAHPSFCDGRSSATRSRRS